MSLAFDATLKDLVRTYPGDWLAGIKRPGKATLISPDLSSVSAASDLVFQGDDRLFHLEAQTGPDPDLPRRVLRYNVLLHERFGLPVESFVILLRRRADRADLTGRVQYATMSGEAILDFRFELLRLWLRPYTELLAGGLGMVPLAILGALPENQPREESMASIVDQMTLRINAEVPPPEAKTLLTASFILAGLRVPQDVALDLFRGVEAMQDSSTYQYILNQGMTKGRVEEARHFLLRLGRQRFEEPAPTVVAIISAISDVARLEALADRILTASTWEELLAS